MLNDDEKKLIRFLIQREIADFKEEGKTVFLDDNQPGFFSAEDKYEEFLESLLKRI